MKTNKNLKHWIISILSYMLILPLLLVGCGETKQGTPENRVVVDTTGREVTIPYHVERVAPTIGAFAHITSMLGDSEKIVATVPKLSDTFKNVFPKANPNNHNTENVEDIIASGAQVTFGPKFTSEQISQLESSGVSVIIIDTFANAEEMKNNVTLIGKILGDNASKKAMEFNKYYDENIAYVRDKTKDLMDSEKVKVLDLRFGGGNYTTVNKTDISSFYAEAAGAILPAADYEGTTQQTSMTVGAEQIVKWNPDVIYTMSNEGKDQILNDPGLSSISAVQNKRIEVSPTGTYPWTVRSGEGALMPLFLGKLMYPEIFKDLDIGEKTKEFYKTFYNYDLKEDELAKILKGR